jgi:hypothetical protein
MKRMIFLLIITGIISGNLVAKERVSVLDFKSTGIEKSITEGVVEILTSSLIDSGKYTVVERSRIEEIYDELALQNSDDFDDDLAVEVGDLLGAEIIMLGSVAKFGETITISVRGVSVRNGSAIFSKKVTVPGENAIVPAVDQLVSLVTGKGDGRGNFTVEEDFSYLLESGIGRPMTGAWLGDSYERVMHRLRLSTRIYRITERDEEIIMLGTQYNDDHQAFTAFQFADDVLVNISIIYDVEDQYIDSAFDSSKIRVTSVTGSQLQNSGENIFSLDYTGGRVSVSKLQHRKDTFIMIQMSAEEQQVPEAEYIETFARKPYFIDTSQRNGFDLSIGASLIYNSPVKIGVGVPFSMTFYANRMFSAGFTLHSGILLNQLVEDPQGSIAYGFFNVNARFKVGKQTMRTRFIFDIGLHNALIGGVAFERSIIQPFTAYAAGSFINLGIELRNKRFSFEALFFLSRNNYTPLMGTALPVYDSTKPVYEDGEIVIGIELRTNLLVNVKTR